MWFLAVTAIEDCHNAFIVIPGYHLVAIPTCPLTTAAITIGMSSFLQLKSVLSSHPIALEITLIYTMLPVSRSI